jgi:hypothetical protein
MPEPFWEHSDLADIVRNEIGSPLKEIFLHDVELFLEEGTISVSHFKGVTLE